MAKACRGLKFTIGALIIRIGFWGILYQIPYSNYSGPYIRLTGFKFRKGLQGLGWRRTVISSAVDSELSSGCWLEGS